jgi:hypothetical protein
MRLYYRNRNHPQIPQAGKWFISWAYEIFTAEHTESAEFFAPIFLRGLCGEKEIGPLFYPLPQAEKIGERSCRILHEYNAGVIRG